MVDLYPDQKPDLVFILAWTKLDTDPRQDIKWIKLLDLNFGINTVRLVPELKLQTAATD